MSEQNITSPSPDFWKSQMKFWLGFLIVFSGFLYLFSPILLPFVLGIVVAYLLNPVVNKITEWKLSRTFATVLILGSFVTFLVIAFGILLPIISAELLKLIKNLPEYFNQFWAMTEPYRNSLKEQFGEQEMEQFKASIESSSGKILEISQGFLDSLISSGQAMVGFMSVLVIMPIVAFYMMIEWPKITNWIDSNIPAHHGDTIRGLLKEMDKKLSGFIRGQFLVAFVLGVLYAAAMKIAGLKFGLIIGLSAGILSIIPLVGSTIGLLAGVVVAYFQTYDPGYVALIAAIFSRRAITGGQFPHT